MILPMILLKLTHFYDLEFVDKEWEKDQNNFPIVAPAMNKEPPIDMKITKRVVKN